MPIAVVLCMCLEGCGKSDPHKPPKLATADALIDYFNSLTTKEPVNVASVHALYLSESDLQAKLIELDRKMTVMFDLDAAMQAKFKEPWNPDKPKAFSPSPNQPAKIADRKGNRAEAECVERDGSITRLYLVENNGQWWISGLTLENNPGLKVMVEQGNLVETDKLLAPMATHGKAVADRVRAGEFKTADDARKAMVIALAPATAPSTQPGQ